MKHLSRRGASAVAMLFALVLVVLIGAAIDLALRRLHPRPAVEQDDDRDYSPSGYR
jgi:hypothetical protein